MPPALGQPTVEPLSIHRDGESIRVNVPSANGKRLVLEARELIAQSPEWNPVLRLNSTASGRGYYDPVCRVQPSRFFRVREASDGGLPWADNFKLLDVNGQAHELYYHTDVPVIVVMSVGESLDHLAPYLSEIQALRKLYGGKMKVWALHCQPDVDREALRTKALQLGIDFPVLMDPSQSVTRNLNPSHFPEVFAVRSLDWTHFYQGAITTSVDTPTGMVDNHYLRDALSEQFANDPISVELAESVGEPVALEPLGEISYREDIAPMVATHCLRCHSKGNIGPFPLDSYQSVLENAFLIKHQVMSGEMPPWHADNLYGRFANETRLSPVEKAKLIEWVNRGALRDEGDDPLSAASVPDSTDWPLGEPDYIVEIPEQMVPADGVVDYRYLVVGNPIPNDVWLKAAVIVPGDPKIVHHSLVFMIEDPRDLFAVRGGLTGFYAGYVPGLDPEEFPEGTGKFLPRDAAFVFQQHYTPTGKATTDVTRLGLYVADQAPEMSLQTAAAFSVNINIAIGDPDSRLSATARITEDSWLFEMSPHMHYRGKHFRFDARYPDGTSETLLSTPDYRFDWQRMYRLKEPKFLPAGTTIRCIGGFDNSPQNRWNPDPTQRVRFGEQSWDEMFIGYFNFGLAL